jgi:hypothetical protein
MSQNNPLYSISNEQLLLINILNTMYNDNLNQIQNLTSSNNEIRNLIIRLLNNGQTLYKSSGNQIIKLCSQKKCNNKCDKECFKNALYKSIRNVNRGIKTIYHLLFKIIIIQPKFRNLCKCCENSYYIDYLLNLEKNFIEKKSNIVENINTKLEPKILLELQINFFINKFMNIIGLLPCECKFKNKYVNFYKDNYLNFRETIKIYTRSVPFVIKLLKLFYDIKDNHEELYLIKEKRCIHEDIRFNNLTFCKNKRYENINYKLMNEIIMNLEIRSVSINF